LRAYLTGDIFLAQEQFQYTMYSDGQEDETPSLVRAMSTDNEVQQVSSPSAYLLDDNGDGNDRNNVVSVKLERKIFKLLMLVAR